MTETFSVRATAPDGTRPRRTFDALQDALDLQARRRTARRWRPHELREEERGRLTLAEFYELWFSTGCHSGPSRRVSRTHSGTSGRPDR